MLQNDKYMDFAADNSVDLIAEQDLDKGVEKKDPKVDTYDAKDENGNPVKYMKHWPNLTFEEMKACYASPAPGYNDTKGIPYIAIVNPHTLKKIKGMNSTSAKSLIADITAAQEQLEKDHGRPMKRSTLKKFKASVKSIEEQIGKGAAKALADLNKLKTSIAKEPETLKTEAGKLEEKVLDAVKADLDKAEGLIAGGDMKAATAILKGYNGLFEKGSELETRLKDLLAKTKPAAEPAK